MVANAQPEVVDVDAVSSRLTWAFDVVLPDACFEVVAEPAGGILVKITTESHEAELHRLPQPAIAALGGPPSAWSWKVWATYPKHRLVARSNFLPFDFDSAAGSAIAVLCGAAALERMAVSPAVRCERPSAEGGEA